MDNFGRVGLAESDRYQIGLDAAMTLLVSGEQLTLWYSDMLKIGAVQSPPLQAKFWAYRYLGSYWQESIDQSELASYP